jgi:hypothetical protein
MSELLANTVQDQETCCDNVSSIVESKTQDIPEPKALLDLKRDPLIPCSNVLLQQCERSLFLLYSI